MFIDYEMYDVYLKTDVDLSMLAVVRQNSCYTHLFLLQLFIEHLYTTLYFEINNIDVDIVCLNIHYWYDIYLISTEKTLNQKYDHSCDKMLFELFVCYVP